MQMHRIRMRDLPLFRGQSGEFKTVLANGFDVLGPKVDQRHVVAMQRKMSAHIAANCAAAEHYDALTHHLLLHVITRSDDKTSDDFGTLAIFGRSNSAPIVDHHNIPLLSDLSGELLMAREPGRSVVAGTFRHLPQSDRRPDDFRPRSGQHNKARHRRSPQVQSLHGVADLATREGFEICAILIGQWHQTTPALVLFWRWRRPTGSKLP